MHTELRNWFLYNLEISQYLPKTKLPDNAQSEEDSINNPPKTMYQKKYKNKRISNSLLELLILGLHLATNRKPDNLQ